VGNGRRCLCISNQSTQKAECKEFHAVIVQIAVTRGSPVPLLRSPAEYIP
jgi:hypothetical protein